MKRLVILALLALPVAAQKPHELCEVCHTETVKDFLTHPHFQKGLECNLCHGESVKHRTSQGHAEPDRVAPPHEIPALCGGCHTGKGPKTIQAEYAASKHGKLVLEQAKVRAPHCGTCHGVHSVRKGNTVEVQCRKCHAALPASCSAAPPKASVTVSCAACHSPHTLAPRR
ncbi:MAG: hypothetical protein HY238_21710 [Acidobacteria bacterium]|nr:hypothetical protein [Acidobacteriota bacterium]